MNQLYVTRRADFRRWLEDNHAAVSEVWLIFYRKHTGRPNIPLDDAIEEAICFGWIDSLIKKLDEDTYMRRFTPRRDGSNWTERSRALAEKMIDAARMTDAGLVKLRSGRTLAPAPWKNATDFPRLPGDLEKAIQNNSLARRNFAGLTPRYVTMCLSWIEAAKRPETRAKRICEFVDLTAKNARLGMK